MMKWLVEGAHTETGDPMMRILDAPSERIAKALARHEGVVVAHVSPVEEEAQHVLEYEKPAEPVKIPAATRGPSFICPNLNCGYKGPSVAHSQGSTGVAVLLLLLGLLPGIIYIAVFCRTLYACPKCGNQVKL
jgi:hypothetical protein